MSKRTAYNGHFGERKKVKLETSVTDHHFPLSQHPSSSKKDDDWDDDIEDEMLIQVSQVCEQAVIDTSFLPDYMAWKQPSSTSTQYQSTPSTSKVSSTNKTPFTFKKPSANPPSAFSTHPIASPLPGIANKVIPETKGLSNITDDLVINTNKASGGQEDYVYRQWLQLKEENEKLKSDNDKLLEKCVTKDGEASILRTQLKSIQQAVDNARMEKTRAQENVKMEYTEKLSAVNNQVSDLRTQLEFKTLEIISVKEKFKKMESGKVKLTQVTVPNNDISYRNNCVPYDMTQPVKKVSTTSSNMQTENQAPFVKLNKSCTKGAPMITEMLPQVLEPTQQQHSILEYNENLQKRTDYQHKRTTHVSPSTSAPKEYIKEKDTDNRMHELLACLEKDPYDFGNSRDKCFQLFGTVNEAVVYLQHVLENTARSVTTAFLKEMDERYIEASGVFLPFNVQNLLQGRELYREEQGIRARRLVAVLGTSLETPTVAEMFHHFQEETSVSILDTAIRICELIDQCSCGIYYSGFLLSLTYVFETIVHRWPARCGAVARYAAVARAGARAVLGCRGAGALSLAALRLVRATEGLQSVELPPLCRSGGDLSVDYDQGVLLYTKDSCFLQVLLKQTEASLKCIQTQNLVDEALKSMEHLAALYGNISSKHKSSAEKARCQCQVMLVQILVYCLQICATMLTKQADSDNNYSGKHKFISSRLLGACRSGVQALYQCSLRDAAFLSRLSHYAGQLEDATDRLQVLDRDELYSNMRQELQGACAGDAAPRARREPWLASFEHFCVTD